MYAYILLPIDFCMCVYSAGNISVKVCACDVMLFYVILVNTNTHTDAPFLRRRHFDCAGMLVFLYRRYFYNRPTIFRFVAAAFRLFCACQLSTVYTSLGRAGDGRVGGDNRRSDLAFYLCCYIDANRAGTKNSRT